MGTDNGYYFTQQSFIDSHKVVTPLAFLAMMWHYNAWESSTAWIYLSTHGTYALLWLYKSAHFGDRQWETKCSILFGVVMRWMAMSLYWIGGWIVMAAKTEPPAWYQGMCIAIFTLGIFSHFVSDMQKHMHMTYCKGTLITTGLFSLTRNPNYLGEFLTYLGYGLLARSWWPIAVLASIMTLIWIPNMKRKDKSLSRYPAYAAWKARTSRFIPFLDLV